MTFEAVYDNATLTHYVATDLQNSFEDVQLILLGVIFVLAFLTFFNVFKK